MSIPREIFNLVKEIIWTGVTTAGRWIADDLRNSED